MEEKPLIVVVGVTGKQGAAAAKHLLRSGKYRVKGISRTPNSSEAQEAVKTLGIDIIKADCMDKQSLLHAFKGAYGVFGITNP